MKLARRDTIFATFIVTACASFTIAADDLSFFSSASLAHVRFDVEKVRDRNSKAA